MAFKTSCFSSKLTAIIHLSSNQATLFSVVTEFRLRLLEVLRAVTGGSVSASNYSWLLRLYNSLLRRRTVYI